MFQDSLIESTRHIEKRRGWTTLVSTSIQILVIALLIVVPLLRPNAISAHLLQTPVVPRYISQVTSSGSHRPAGVTDSGRRTLTIVQMVQPHSIPRVISTEPEPVGIPDPTRTICLSNCGSSNNIGPNMPFGSDTFPQVTLKPPKALVISKLDPGQILRRVEPLYPQMAKIARVQGPVQLHAIINRDGVIERLEVLSGNPLLDKAALDAVSQWRFRPYILNGQPIEVETQITVNFVLNQ